jgi:hypothetical protein
MFPSERPTAGAKLLDVLDHLQDLDIEVLLDRHGAIHFWGPVESMTPQLLAAVKTLGDYRRELLDVATLEAVVVGRLGGREVSFVFPYDKGNGKELRVGGGQELTVGDVSAAGAARMFLDGTNQTFFIALRGRRGPLGPTPQVRSHRFTGSKAQRDWFAKHQERWDRTRYRRDA